MSSFLASLVLLAPLALITVALLSFSEPGLRPNRILKMSRLATIGAFLLALGGAILVALAGALTSPVIGIGELGFSVRLDALSGVMLLLVSFVGVIVVRFSRHYLDGDPRQGVFLGRLCLTLAAVILLVSAGNLLQLVVAWIATSLALHSLLLFYPERPAAVVAARKKFITARIGDACLIGAVILLFQGFGTLDIADILTQARNTQDGMRPPGIALATLLIAIAALLKSAQFPTHGWLPEVMETPTPVSALLHAGIINAGGFLVIRFADVMLLSMPSLHFIAIVGGFTALFGGVVMLTQPSVKVSLAWSTVAQMGFMLLQCGLGAFSMAVLHIVAHSLYKAHAFLSSGSVIDIAKTAWTPDLKARPSMGLLFLSLALALGLYAGIGGLFSALVDEAFTVLALGMILIMGLTLLIAQSMQGETQMEVVGRILVAAAFATGIYFILQAFAAWLLSSTLPPIPTPDIAGFAIMVLAVVSFAAVTVLQVLAPVWLDSPTWRAARVHIANGLYANTLFNRIVSTRKLLSRNPS
nr:proton-conducting transporter membrane subunit [uncultured Halomonas sp.]